MGDSRARPSQNGCDGDEEERLTDEQERLRARTAVALYLFAGVAIGGAVAIDGCFAAVALDGRARRDILGAFVGVWPK